MRTEFRFRTADAEKTVTVDQEEDTFLVAVDGRTYRVASPHSKDGAIHGMIDGRPVRAVVARQADRWHVHIDGAVWILKRPATRRSGREASEAVTGDPSGLLTASMPGQVVDVLVKPGDEVERGQTLVLLEAMKMELRISAPFAGVVRRVHCAAGQTVERQAPLVELDENTA